MNRALKIVLISLAAVVLVGAPLLYPAWVWSRDLRADKLSAEATELASAGQAREAFKKAWSAHLFNRGDDAIRLQVAQLALEARMSDCMAYWKPVLNLGLEVSLNDLEKLARFLSENGEREELFDILALINQRDPANTTARALHLTALESDFDYYAILALTNQWIKDGANDVETLKAHADALLALPEDAFGQRAMAFLEQLSLRDDALGFDSIKRILLRTQLPSDRDTWVERLDQHPTAQLEDRMFAAEWRSLRANNTDFEQLDERMQNLHRQFATEVGSSPLYFSWLERADKPALILERLSQDDALTDETLARIYLNALIATGKADQALQITLGREGNLPLSESLRMIARARALTAMGEQESAENALRIAVENVELEDFSKLEFEFSRMDRWDSLQGLYGKLAESRITREFTDAKMVFANYFLSREPDLVGHLDRISPDSFAADPNIEMFLLYLKIIYKRGDFIDACQRLEDQVTAYPGMLQGRMLLALAHLMDGNEDTATEIARLVPATLPEDLPRYVRVVHLILANQLKEAQLQGDQLLQAKLLPRERTLAVGNRAG